MSTSLFKITPTPPTSIQVQPGQEGKLSFTVESLAAPDKVHEIMLQALVVAEDGKGKEVDWLVAGPRRTLSMSGGKTETVTITARPVATSPRGVHSVKLVIADKERPNDVYADAPTVACEVLAPAGAAKPPPKLPWWLIPAIAGGVLVLVGGALLIWKLARDPAPSAAGLGEACRGDTAAACDEGLVCVTGVQKCLLVGGATCKPAQSDLCASGECERELEVCTLAPGATCDPGDKDVVPCHTNGVCDPVARKCLGTVGAACKADVECETGKCTGNVCAIKAPSVKPGDPCADTCPDPLQCSATAKRCVEQVGRPCSNNNQCSTGLCEANVCTRPELLRNCTTDGICGLDQSCVEVQSNLKRCKWQAGHACTSNGECSSKLGCNRGVCARDDGRCQSQSDCPSPYQCIAAKQVCLKPNGVTCGGHAECDSAFCKDNRCAPSPCLAGCGPRFVCNNDPIRPACIPILHKLRSTGGLVLPLSR